MVIDAWRLSFLVDPDSPMAFLRGSIASGRGVAFATTVQTPTVTMPRIKALTSGMIPSFISLVTNFFATANTDDNWVTSAASMGKKIMFFGDDTWLRLFPDAFTISEGVTSFFVNDFTEVDNNVTRHLDSKLNDDDWDVLILHYLGLDHIGHSLGGISPELNRKLREMDSIAERIFKTMSRRLDLLWVRCFYFYKVNDHVHIVFYSVKKICFCQARAPVLLVVMADHGMTSSGSHGGGSEAESRVPMAFLHSRAMIKRGGNLHGMFSVFNNDNGELPAAQQVDLAGTMPYFLSTEIPSESIGLSLIPRLAEHWKLADSTIFSAAVQSAIHFSRFMEAYVQSSQAAKISRQAQQEIIKSQEQVLGWPIYVGLLLIVLGFMVLTGLSCDASRPKPPELVFHDHVIYFVFGLYHISSYSTSLIEEEHDIWYYIASTVILLYLLKDVRSHKIISSQSLYYDTRCRAGVVLLTLHRLGMSFTAHSRRRWSMRPDLLPQPLVPECRLYLPLVDYSVADLSPSLLFKWCPFLTTTVCICYFLRRIQPQAMPQWQRAVPYFLSILICWRVMLGVEHRWLVYLILAGVIATLRISFPLGAMLYLCYLVRPENIPPLVISFEMGRIMNQVTSSPNLYAILCQTVFFYQGQSSNISSIDIAVGYRGLSSYMAVFVGFQILVNFYAAPFALTLGLV
ncbi:hypothetical protein ANCCAN_12891 [Ancylostoma caninum]|uniref:GPI ethanolamine phosphate transferase 2 C-terminal domain-containing protein n=1 Tax=Ancylostoma caninum TaxID=29170 RepID=A0A368G9T4_ANCCA|nr:hypothetical protein ANCCAN_12891 [Ancylostoma caninum]